MTLPTVFSFPVLRCTLFCALLVTGCSDNESAEPVDSFAATVEARAGVPFAQEGAVVSLVAPASVSPGKPVPIKLQVKNETSAPLDLYLRGREVTFDILVSDGTGDAVWSRLNGEVTQAILQLKTLAPGEVMELTHTWDQTSQRGTQVPPGRYTIRGSVATDGRSTLESPPATLDVTAN